MTIDTAISNIELLKSEFIRCEYRNGVEPDNSKVQRYFQQLGRVPLNLQEIMANEGAYIAFFNGLITDNPEMQNAKGVRPRNWDRYTWDDVCAAHDPSSKAILIGIEGGYVGMDDPFLHEFGHSFDDGIGKYISGIQLFGKRFFAKSLSQRRDVLRALKTEPFSREYLQHPREYVANSVNLYYRSDKTREQLERFNPSMLQLLQELESI